MNDAVIAVSREVQTRIEPYVRNGSPRLYTIPNAVDPEMFEGIVVSREEICQEFGFPSDARIVVNVANLVAKKGHRYLLAAAKRVIGNEPRARFLLVGTGPLGTQLSIEARRHGLDGHVVFTGFREDATRLMAAADVFVLSSLHEGLPVSLLEAMALGKPAVVTRVGGVPEVAVANETAVVVEAADDAALAAGIAGLLRDPSRRQEIGESARRFVRQRYGMAQMVAAVENVYQQVVGQ
jgi:glycosyltransferase involved in cell wall biosynthesis